MRNGIVQMCCLLRMRRHWQELGYLLLYVTAQSDVTCRCVVSVCKHWQELGYLLLYVTAQSVTSRVAVLSLCAEIGRASCRERV